MTPLDLSGRFSRQADLVPQEKQTERSHRCGSVGDRSMQREGRHLQLFDFDTVEPTNITTQGYGFADLNQPKVVAMQEAINRIDPEIIVTPIPDRFRASYEAGEVVFCAVDKIDARKAIWRMAGKHRRFWSDGRMLGETIRVLSASNEDERKHYETTLFPASEAQAGRCTARSTIYAANICAALMVHQFSRWLRETAPGPRSRHEPVGE